MVLSAIMLMIDSLLIVASGRGRARLLAEDQNPDIDDERLMRWTRKVTLGLSLVLLLIGIGIMLVDKEKKVSWTIIFGWSGIAATFCPVMILSSSGEQADRSSEDGRVLWAWGCSSGWFRRCSMTPGWSSGPGTSSR